MEPMTLLSAFEWVAAGIESQPDPVEVQARINMTDADNECPHGALPLDSKKPDGCDCWTQARAAALARNSGQPLCEASMHWPDLSGR